MFKTKNKNNQIRITITKMSNLKIVDMTKISNFTAARRDKGKLKNVILYFNIICITYQSLKYV